MSYFQSINFDFVDGRYTLKLTNQFQSIGLSGVKELEKSKITYRNELNTLSFPKFTAMDFNLFFTRCYFLIKKNNDKRNYY